MKDYYEYRCNRQALEQRMMDRWRCNADIALALGISSRTWLRYLSGALPLPKKHAKTLKAVLNITGNNIKNYLLIKKRVDKGSISC